MRPVFRAIRGANCLRFEPVQYLSEDVCQLWLRSDGRVEKGVQQACAQVYMQMRHLHLHLIALWWMHLHLHLHLIHPHLHLHLIQMRLIGIKFESNDTVLLLHNSYFRIFAQRCRTSVFGIMSCHLMLPMRHGQRMWNWSSLHMCRPHGVHASHLTDRQCETACGSGETVGNTPCSLNVVHRVCKKCTVVSENQISAQHLRSYCF